MCVLPLRQHGVRLIQRQRILALFPGFFSVGKRLVIHLTAGIQRVIKKLLLMLGWVESILHRFTHNHKDSSIA